jgi:tetratricopeptide (TPR) repeat protein
VEIKDSFNNITDSSVNVTIEPPHITPKVLTHSSGLNDNFIGRKKELQDIEAMLDDKHALLLLNGIGGIGKSSLASHYFNEHKHNYSYYGFIEATNGLQEAFVTALKASLNLQSSDNLQEAFYEAITKLRSLEGTKLLVIDDIRNSIEQKKEIERVGSLRKDGFRVLFTSREQYERLPHYFLDTMNQEDAIQLFQEHFKSDEIDKIEKILVYLDKHTYFIEMTAKTLAKRKDTLTLDTLLEKFEQGAFSTIKKDRKESFNGVLNDLFAYSPLLNDDEILKLLQKFTLLPSIEIAFDRLYEVLVCDDREMLQDLLIELVESGWLIKGESSYKLHQIIKEYILANHTPSIETIEPQIDYFYTLIKKSSASDNLSDKLSILPYYQSLLDIFAKINYQDKRVGEFENRLGLLHDSLGEYDDAMKHYQQSLKIQQEIGDRNGEGTTLNNISQIYDARGDYTTALQYLEKSLKIHQEIGDRNGEGATLNNISQIYNARGDYTTALHYLEKSLKIRQEIGDKSGMCATLFNMGHIYVVKDEVQEALGAWVKAYQIAKPMGLAQVLDALEDLANYLGLPNGLESWEMLAQRL